MKHFPANTPAHYYTDLPHNLDLSGREFEVGLAEIQFPNTYSNLENGWIAYSNGTRTTKKILKLPTGLYDSPEHLVSTLNNLLSTEHSPAKRKNKRTEFVYNRSTRLVSIQLNGYQGCKMQLSPQLSEILGLREDEMIGLNMLKGRNMIDIHKNSYSMYVYCDLVTHRQVGDMLVTLLRIVPTIDKTLDVVYHSFEKPHYQTLNRHQFNTIEIILRTDTGKTPSFVTGTTVVTLHFRAVKH